MALRTRSSSKTTISLALGPLVHDNEANIRLNYRNGRSEVGEVAEVVNTSIAGHA